MGLLLQISHASICGYCFTHDCICSDHSTTRRQQRETAILTYSPVPLRNYQLCASMGPLTQNTMTVIYNLHSSFQDPMIDGKFLKTSNILHSRIQYESVECQDLQRSKGGCGLLLNRSRGNLVSGFAEALGGSSKAVLALQFNTIFILVSIGQWLLRFYDYFHVVSFML